MPPPTRTSSTGGPCERPDARTSRSATDASGVSRGRSDQTRLPRRQRGTRRFVILTGLSGAGKTQAIRALEDLGYLLRRQPADAADPDDGRARVAARMPASRRWRSSSTCARAASSSSSRASSAGCKAMPGIDAAADLPRSEPVDARPAVQRDAPAASARARPIGRRGDRGRAREDEQHPLAWRI